MARRGEWLAALWAALVLAGCAPASVVVRPEVEPRLETRPSVVERVHAYGRVERVAYLGAAMETASRTVSAGLVRVDEFESVLLEAGHENINELPACESALSPEDAAELYELLVSRPVKGRAFGARMVATYLLSEVMAGEREVERGELLERVRRFSGVAVLRPDGYLAWVLGGRTQQIGGELRLESGALKAGLFEVGRFYQARGGVFYEMDEALQEVPEGMRQEVYDDADVISRTAEGVEEAFFGLATTVGGLLTEPIRSVSQLEHLPRSVALLLLHSPEYFERFRLMTRGEQVRALSKLMTTVLVTWGGAAKVSRTVAAAGEGAELAVPVARLTAEGAVALRWEVVGMRSTVQALGGGPGALFVLSVANQGGRGPVVQGGQVQGPGRWEQVKEFMSARAARYQHQITGRLASEAYVVKGVRFDGFRKAMRGLKEALLEAKGKGYANKFNDDLTPKVWFEKGARNLVDQAQRQFDVAGGTPVHWHVAEEKAARAIQKLLMDNDIATIQVIYTPSL